MQNKIKEISFTDFCDILEEEVWECSTSIHLCSFYVSEGIFLKRVEDIDVQFDDCSSFILTIYRALILNFPGKLVYYSPYDVDESLKTTVPKSLFWDEYSV